MGRTKSTFVPRVSHLWVLLLALVLAVPALQAQSTTGAIEGVVKDASGAVLPGATVEATGPAGVVRAVSDEAGEFRFPRLLPGRYKVSATLSGFSTRESDAMVTVDKTSRVEFGLAVGGVAENVQVSASAIIDMTTPATATNITRERIELLPSGRDFSDVVAQAAGASNESQAGGISIDGSSGSENRFVIDGVDTTDPQEGINAVPLRKDFVEEIQVKSAGYSAEFGGSTGGVINVITRSGTNNFRGGAIFEAEKRKWGGDERPLLRDSLTSNTFTYINPPKDDRTRIDPGFFIGGPVLRDRLWFFGSYQPGIRDTDRTVFFSNGVVNTFNEDYRENFGTFNVTGNAGSKLLFKGGGNFSPYTREGTLPDKDGRTSLTNQADWTRGVKFRRETYSGSVDYVPTSQFIMSGRLGRFLTDQESTGITFPGKIHNINSTSTPAGIANLPEPFRRQAGFVSDVLVTDATERDEYIRDFVKLDATYYLSKFGEHTLKGGFQTEKIGNDARTGYNADRIIYYAGRPYTTTTGQVVQGQYGYFRLLNISTFGKVGSRNNSLFVQDTWRVNPRLTLDIGLRTEHEKVPNFGTTGVSTPIEFGYGDKLAPRIGFAYDVMGDQKWKLYGSYGRFYDVMKYEMPRGSFGGEKWVDYFYSWDSPDWTANAASTCGTGANTIAERPACPAGRFIEPVDRRFNAAEDLDETVDPDLKPMSMNEYQIGITRELPHNLVVGARYVRKPIIRTIEDVGVLVPGIGEVFYIANPGEGISLSLMDPSIPGFPEVTREYDALEVTLEKRFANRWQLFANYTLSRLYGNYSGLASSDEDGRTSPNVNRFFDHIENTFDRNGDPVLGRLGTDRPHALKAQVVYQTKWDMTIGATQRIASGIPISEEANVGAGVPFFPFGRGNLGRTDVWNQTDLQLVQRVKLSRYTLQFEAIILNLFDNDLVTRVYNNRTVGNLPLTTAGFFAGGWDYNTLLQTPGLLDVKYNQPDQFLAPREIRLGVKFTF
jgi:outer membrane receptor protein involved in Fe transport